MNTQGTRWRGKLPIPKNSHPLVRQMFEIMNRHKITCTDMESAGIRRATISDWRYCSSPQLINFEAALNKLGYKLQICKIYDKKAEK